MKSKTQKFFKEQHGISLVALIVTIIVMLILAGIVIAAAVADGGVIDRAQTAVLEKERGEIEDIVKTSYVFEKVASTQNSSIGLDLKATGIAIYKNLTRAGFELLRTSSVDGETAAEVTGPSDNPTGINLSVKGNGDEVTYIGTLDKYGLVGGIKIINGPIPPPPAPEIGEFEVELGVSGSGIEGDLDYDNLNYVEIYPIDKQGNYMKSYDYLVAQKNSKELMLEQINYLFEAEAKLRKAIDNMIVNYDLQKYLDDTELLTQKLEEKKPTGEEADLDKYEFDSQSALMGALLIKDVYQYKNNASKTAVANGEQESEITEIFFDESGNPRQFTTLEEAVEYLKKADRVETILRHDFVLGIMTMEGDLEDLNVDVMSSMIDSGDDFDFKGLFTELDKMEGNTARDIYNMMLTLMGEEDNGEVDGKDLNVIGTLAILTEIVPEIQNMDIFEYFDKENEEIKQAIGGRTIFEFLKDTLVILDEEKTDHAQLQRDIDGIYEVLNGWKNCKAFTVADQMKKAMSGDYENYKIRILDEDENILGNDFYYEFEHKADPLGETGDYLTTNYIGITLQKDLTQTYFKGNDKLTVEIYNGDDLIQTVTKTLAEFDMNN